MDPASNQLLQSHAAVPAEHRAGRRDSEGLIDVLDRVLDKGVVIAGDIRINLLDIELLTIKVRLLIASADKAREMGIDWWASDPHLTSKAGGDKAGGDREKENKALRERVERLEAQLKALTDRGANGAGSSAGHGAGGKRVPAGRDR